ncbi:malto-oligosyltrehalose synthase [Paracidovorax citrulli]
MSSSTGSDNAADKLATNGADTLVPRATARLQLHRDFTFEQATAQVDYLAALGASHLYLSPIFASTPGSTHGYDVTDFHRINPELGGEEGFRRLAERARAAGLGIIIDIVPNHMAASVTHNGWWRDVLARGPQSRYAGHFDIDWNSPDPLLQGKVLLPILGNAYWDMLHSGELRIEIDGGKATLHYGEHSVPLSEESVAQAGVIEAGADAFQPGSEGGVQRLHELLERQHYRLAWWRTAADELNWRRFFEVSELVAVRVEQPAVFDDVHSLVLRLAREGWIDGVRVDHVDGLADPGGYCKQLRQALDEAMAGRNARGWIVVEKILSEQETLRASWGIDGTTGYDFMDEVAAVLHDGAGQPELDAMWRQTVGEAQDYGALVRASRRRMLERHLVTEFEGACRRLHAAARAEPATRDLTLASFRRALAALLEPIEVYRTYLGEHEGTAENRREDTLILEEAAAKARRDVSPDDPATVNRIVEWLSAEQLASPQLREVRARVQQLMPPLAAKAGEDTMFYRYGRLLSRNEVGSHPSTLAMPPDRFHARMVARAHRWPHAMLATATHDHKRGEDNRIRLAVLSELAADWHAAVRGWESMAAPLVQDGAPDAVDRLMLYQTLVGVWPPTLPPEAVPGQPTSSGGGAVSGDAAYRDATETLLERVRAWQTKSVREAKRHGHWTSVDERYEAAYADFLKGLHDNGLLRAIATFAHSIAAAGALNSLAQTLLQLTAPGVPDRYQGAEGWDFSLVDPDNRRPVDYPALRSALACEAGWQAWLEDWRDGRVKVQLVRALLALRQSMPALFRDGAYRQLHGEGDAAQHVLALERSLGDQRIVAVTARAAARMVDAHRPCIDAAHWGDTRLCLSGGASAVPAPDQPWTEVLTGRTVTPVNGRIAVADLLSPLPVAVLTPAAAHS